MKQHRVCTATRHASHVRTVTRHTYEQSHVTCTNSHTSHVRTVTRHTYEQSHVTCTNSHTSHVRTVTRHTYEQSHVTRTNSHTSHVPLKRHSPDANAPFLNSPTNLRAHEQEATSVTRHCCTSVIQHRNACNRTNTRSFRSSKCPDHSCCLPATRPCT